MLRPRRLKDSLSQDLCQPSCSPCKTAHSPAGRVQAGAQCRVNCAGCCAMPSTFLPGTPEAFYCAGWRVGLGLYSKMVVQLSAQNRGCTKNRTGEALCAARGGKERPHRCRPALGVSCRANAPAVTNLADARCNQPCFSSRTDCPVCGRAAALSSGHRAVVARPRLECRAGAAL